MKRNLSVLMVLLQFVVLGLQAQTNCTAPTGLSAKVHYPEWRNAQLQWTPVEYASTTTCGYTQNHPMIYYSGSDFTAVIRIPADSMARLSGKSLTGVKFEPYLTAPCNTYIRIWQGGSVDTVAGTINPGTLLVNQLVTQTLVKRADNIVPLSSPVEVNPSQEIWIGLRFEFETGTGYPMMYDNNICVNYASNLVYTPVGGWSIASGRAWYINGLFANTSELVTYNVYRDNVLMTNLSTNIFEDTLISDGTYYYEVKALHANNCESAAIADSVVMNDDNVITVLPYVQNFDGVTGNTGTTLANHVLPEGWGWINYGSTNAGYPSVYSTSSYASSAPNSLRFHNYNTTANTTAYSDQYAILPPIDIATYPINTLQMEFNARRYSTTTTYDAIVVVGVMSSFSDPSTFVPVDTIEPTTTTHAPFIVNFSSYTGSGRYIALKVPRPAPTATRYNSVLMDDIYIDEVPTCPKPTNLASVSGGTTQTSFTVTWTENGTATEWEVEYGLSGYPAGTGTKLLSYSGSQTITGLLSGTIYDVRVRAICGAGDTSQYSAPLQVSTMCGTLVSLPYTQNFDAFPGLTTATATATNLGQFCWSQMVVGSSVSATSSYRGYPIVYSNSTYSQSGLNALRFYSYTTATTYGDEYAVMPPIDVTVYPINTLQLEFFASRFSTYAFNFEVGVMTDSSDATTFVPVEAISIPTTSPTQTYNYYIVDFSSYTGNGRFIAFRMLKPTSGYLAGYIDDVTLSTIPNCMRPINVSVSNVMDQTAEVEWSVIGGATAWDLAVVLHNAAIDENQLLYAADSSYQLTGLTPNTAYDVYVRANCGSEVSIWSFAESFTTRCAPLASPIPFTENFDSYPAATAAASGVIPACWTKNTNNPTSYPFIYSTYHASGTGSLYFYATTAYYSLISTPLLDLSAYNAGELMLSFKAMKNSSTSGYGRIQVGVMTDVDDLNTLTILKNVTTNDYSTLGVWEDFRVVLPNHYATPVYLVFYLPSTGTAYTYIDDIVLDYLPDCMSPTDVSVKDVSGTSAKVVWKKAFHGASDYMVEYSVAGQNNWQTAGITAADNYTLYGLEPETSYEVRVTSLCSAGTALPATSSFSTPCLIPEFTQVGTGTGTSSYVPMYTAYQYGYSQQLYRASEDLNSTAMAINALAFQYAGSGSTTRTIDIYLMQTMETSVAAWIPTTNAQLVFSGDIQLRPNMSDGGWITVMLDSTFQYDGMSNLLVAVYTHNSVATNTVATDKVFRGTSLSNMTRYLYNTSTTTYNPLNVASLTAGTASSYRPNIRFIHCNNNSVCAPPYLAVSDIMNDNVSLEWQPGYQENTWELEYKVASAATWTNEGTLSSVNSYTITNLLANTDYMVRLRAICSDTSAWVTKSFRTPCYPFVTVPFTENFETATGSGAGHFVPCWTTHTNSTTAYPYTSSSATYVHGGTYGTYFYATSAYYSYAASPRFDDSVQMDSLQIRFWARKSTDAYYIQVGIMTNPFDYDSFELLETLTPDTISTWQELSLTTTGYTGNGRHIVFRVPMGATNYMYVDDISVSYITPCSRVADLYATGITNNAATLHWVPGGAEANWLYTYGVKDSVNLASAMFTSTTDTMVDISNLSGNTSYDFYVISDCGGETSDPMKITFTTLCDPISSLPFITDFDDLGGTGSANYPECWTKLYLSTAITTPITTSYPYPSSSYYASAPYSMYFFNNITASSTYSIATLPEFDTSIPVNTLQVDFDLLKIADNYFMLVGAMTDPMNPNTFVVVDTVRCDTIKTFEHKAVSLASYSGNGHYIAFKSCGDGLYLDNLRVDLVPQCDAPTQFAVTAVTMNEITVSWHPEGNETSWELYALPSGSTLLNAVPVIVQTDTFYQFTNLSSGTLYDIYLRAICPGGTGYSSFLLETVSTVCDPVATLPYTVDFDNVDGTTSGAVNNLPLCWNYINTSTVSTSMGYPVVYRGSSYANSGNNSLRFYVYTPSTYSEQTAVLPAINTSVLQMNSLQISCNVRKYSSSYPFFMAIVGVMTDPTQDSTFVPVDTIISTSLQYERKIAYLNHYTGSGSYIAIKAPKVLTENYNSGYIDDIEIDQMSSCLRVEDLRVTQIGTDAITVSWTPVGTESAWIVQYKPATDTVWSDHPATAATTTISNLLPNTAYNMRVIADCGGSYSESSQPIVVTTDCNAMATLPYTTNFDDITGTTSGSANNLPPCWHYLNVGSTNDTYSGYPIVYNNSSEANTGNNSVRFYTYVSGNTAYGDQWAILPGVDANVYPINTLQLKFNAKRYNTSYPFNLIVGVMSDVLDPSTFVAVDTVSPASNVYEPFTIYFNHYTGTGNHLAMMVQRPMSSYNAGYVDDIEVSLTPSCIPVSHVQMVAATSTSISLEWSVNGSETDWIVSYVQFGDTVWTTQHVSGTPSATIQNLTPNTAYHFRVQADCLNGDVSELSAVLLARTECSLITTLPFTENFDGVQGSTTGTVNNLPSCWHHLSGTYASYAGYPIVYNSATYAQSTPNSLRFYTYTGTTDYGDQYAILPPIDVTVYPINTLKLTFAAREASTTSTYDLKLVIGVMTDPSNAGTFVPVDTVESHATTYSNYTVTFGNYTGNGSYIAIMAPRNSGNTYNTGYVDNIVVDVAPVVCNEPTNVTVSNVTPTSATVTWMPGGNETSWELQYREVSDNWSSVTVTGTPSHILTGLSDSTTYEVRVRAVCNAFNTSDWSVVATFTTPAAVVPPTVTTQAADGITTTVATLHGTVTAGSETITAQGFEWKETNGGAYAAVTATGATMSHDLTGLTAGTDYTFRAFATTASGTTYGTEITFTTLEQPQDTCQSPTNVAVTNITESSADVSWTQEGNVTSWDVNYREAGATAWSTVTTSSNPHTLTGLAAETAYEVQVIANCIDGETSAPSSTVTFTTLPVGIADYVLGRMVTLYPNPTTGLVQVQSAEGEVESVEVYDTYGKLLHTTKVSGGTATLNLSGYAKGTYFVKVTTDRGVVTKRVVKM